MKLFGNGRMFLAVLLFVGLGWPCQVYASVAPLTQIKGTVEGILDIMRDAGLNDPARKEERRVRILALVDQRFDFAEMARRTLGRSWNGLTAEERSQFQQLFSDLLKFNYIGRIEAYSDEKIEYDKELFSQNSLEQARVYTKILKNGHEIPINYNVIKKGEEWFVYDVVIEGVSLVRNYQQEFSRILNKEKFPGLVRRMQEKIVSNEATR